MGGYLWRVSINRTCPFSKDMGPVYCVAESKDNAVEYVQSYLRSGYEVGRVARLAAALGQRMFHGA